MRAVHKSEGGKREDFRNFTRQEANSNLRVSHKLFLMLYFGVAMP